MINFLKKIRENALKKKKLKRYFSYAIGEIILVVTGILIALQLNYWNERRKLENRKELYVQLIISDLQSDLKDLETKISFAKQDSIKLSQLKNRISSSEATVDTLINIYRTDFNPRIASAVDYNTTTIDALEASGDINLFPPEIIAPLTNLQKRRRADFEYAVQNLEQYKLSINMVVKKFPAQGFHGSMAASSPMAKKVWDNIDEADFISDINGLITTKFITVQLYLTSTRIIEKKTKDVLEQLKLFSKNL
ncbi:DUF6090 family protein [Salinimicrobium catena]|uniref:DUF6090 family protein n=1 Tax=Salinimicrobium catena TaxID=390640 RepID=UPI002FE4CB57